jgi:hypothetical protein
MLTAKSISASWLVRLAICLLLLYGLFATYIWHAMHQPPEAFGRVMSRLPDFVYPLLPFETMWVHARAGQLQPGDAAPDFSLTTLDKTGKVQLSALSSKQPVVLVFGSYT